MNERTVLGFDIGGTKCAVVLGIVCSDHVEILDRKEFPTQVSRGPEFALQQFEETSRSLLSDHKVACGSLGAIGISCGGPLDSERGIIQSPPNLPGWDNVPIKRRFEAEFAVPVRIQNDANACALAEWKWGAGRGTQNMIFLTFGTGLGAGLVLNGRLYRGTSEMAGEVGHIRLEKDGPVGYGKAGSFEGFCSGGGIAQLARQIVSKHFAAGDAVGFCSGPENLNTLDARLIGQAARAGDSIALEIMTLVGKKLGYGLAILMDILNPQVIVIGSIFVRQRELLWPIAEQVIKEEALSECFSACRVVPSELGEAIGDYACLCVAAMAL